jgi:tetratricopeptide (TPR) repeat protein
MIRFIRINGLLLKSKMSMNQTFELFLSGTDIPHQYKINVAGGDGENPHEDFFELRSDSVELTLTLAALAKAASSGEEPEKDLHLEFGQRIYKLLFGGAVGQYWQEFRKSAGRNPLALMLRIDPKSARFLQRVPWEYLHDGKDFLSTNGRTPLYRLPSNVEPVSLGPLKETLRMLVVIAAPLGLNENEVLHFAREEDLILAATAEARKTGKLRLEFTSNSALETVEAVLLEYRPHLLHFVGHGVFVESEDRGMLLMEKPDGHRWNVWNKDFAELLVRAGRELRGVFLSTCQSAVAPRAEGFPDLASTLLENGIPAVTAMQYSVLDNSAMAFGSTFYKGIVDGRLIEDAFTEARQALNNASPNRVDFATPVLFLSDSNCLQLDLQAGQVIETPLNLSGLTKAQNFVGRAAEIRELQTQLDPQNGTWRAAVIHAIGGMGKTVLAARLAERMAPRLDGVVSLRMSPTTTAQSVLDHIGDFLFAHNARFNLSEIHEYEGKRSEALQLSVRLSMLMQILRRLHLLVVFDNCEDVMSQSRAVSRASQGEEWTSLDPELLPSIASLVEGVEGPTRFLFTSRVDFSPVEENRLADAIGHLPLKEMGFREAVYLMETLPPLDKLPVAALEKFPLPVGHREASRSAAEGWPGVRAQPISMRDVYARLGGHPYRLYLFARHVGRTSVGQVLNDLSAVQRELLDFTLLEKAVEQLSERAALLLHRSVVFEEAVPIEGLAFTLGDEQDAMPDVMPELNALLEWGLAAREPGTEDYAIHSLVREWGQSRWSEAERKEYLRRAARYWLGVGGDSRNVWAYLRARHYLYQAGEYKEANRIVQATYNHLLRWGRLDLLLVLMRQSADTLEEKSKAIALGNLATIFQSLGEYQTAMEFNKIIRQVFEEADDRRNLSVVFHQIGMLHHAQGEYERALAYYQQSLQIDDGLGHRGGVAQSLHQIGILHQDQGEYEQALEYYQQSLQIKEEIGDRAGVASSLHQIGLLHQQQGNYLQALEYYQQSLQIKEEMSDRAGVSETLNNIGRLHQQQGNYLQALEYYQQSLNIDEEIGDRNGLAIGLHNIGMLHQDQGEYERALEFHQKSLKILEEIGNRADVANSLHELGNVHYQQGEYGEALWHYQRSLRMMEELNNRAGMAASLHQIGMLHQVQGRYDLALEYYQQSLKTAKEISDRGSMASSFGQLGLLYEKTDQVGNAIQALAKAFLLFAWMGMPEAEQAKRNLNRLRSKVGNDVFITSIQDMGLPAEAQSALLSRDSQE